MGFILKTWAVWKPVKSTLEELLDVRCLKSRFFKDIFNEIITFGARLEA